MIFNNAEEIIYMKNHVIITIIKFVILLQRHFTNISNLWTVSLHVLF